MTWRKGKSGNLSGNRADGKNRFFASKGIRRSVRKAVHKDKTGLGLNRKDLAKPDPARIAALKKRVKAITKIEIEDPENEQRVKELVLLAISEGVSWQTAVQIAGITMPLFQRWQTEDHRFAEDLRSAASFAIGRLKDRAYEKALGGSERMIEFLLQCYDPDTFAKTRAQTANDANGAVLSTLQAVGRILEAKRAPLLEHEASEQ